MREAFGHRYESPVTIVPAPLADQEHSARDTAGDNLIEVALELRLTGGRRVAVRARRRGVLPGSSLKPSLVLQRVQDVEARRAAGGEDRREDADEGRDDRERDERSEG